VTVQTMASLKSCLNRGASDVQGQRASWKNGPQDSLRTMLSLRRSLIGVPLLDAPGVSPFVHQFQVERIERQ